MTVKRQRNPRKPPIKATAPHVRALFRFMDAQNIPLRIASDKSGVDAVVISKWRSGASSPRLDLFVAVCEGVGVILNMSFARKKSTSTDQMELL